MYSDIISKRLRFRKYAHFAYIVSFLIPVEAGPMSHRDCAFGCPIENTLDVARQYQRHQRLAGDVREPAAVGHR